MTPAAGFFLCIGIAGVVVGLCTLGMIVAALWHAASVRLADVRVARECALPWSLAERFVPCDCSDCDEMHARIAIEGWGDHAVARERGQAWTREQARR